MATTFSVTVDKTAGTITVVANPADYGGGSVAVQVINDTAGTAVMGVPTPTGSPPTTSFPVTGGNEYTVVVTCGGHANVSTVFVPT